MNQDGSVREGRPLRAPAARPYPWNVPDGVALAPSARWPMRFFLHGQATLVCQQRTVGRGMCLVFPNVSHALGIVGLVYRIRDKMGGACRQKQKLARAEARNQ